MIVRVEGLNVHYLTQGRGLPCVIPSLSGSPFYERTFSRDLRDHLQLTFVELRGGRSDVGPISDLTIESLADSFSAFLDTIKLGKTAVLVHSGHGFLGMEFAARHPDQISHLILVGAPPSFATEFEAESARYWEMLASSERKHLAAENDRLLAAESARLSPDEAIIRWYVLRAPSLWFDPRFDCRSLWGSTRPSAEVFDRFWGAGGQWKLFDAAKTLPAIKCPVLIVAGMFDFAVPPTLWYHKKDLIADHEYVLLDRSGHNPQFEESELFNRTVLDWLKRH